MKIINLLFGFLTLFNNVISVPLSVNSTYMNKYNDYIVIISEWNLVGFKNQILEMIFIIYFCVTESRW